MFESQRLHLRNTIARLIEECKNMRELKQIHTQIITSPHFTNADHCFLISRLLFFSAISSSGSLSYAANVFRHINNPNLFAYNAMIRAYSSKINGHNSFQASVLYKQMLYNGISPDCITLPFLVKDCTVKLDGEMGQSIHAQIVRFGFHSDIFVQNSLITLYSSCGFLHSALNIFDEMTNRDIVSWNSIIIGFLRGGCLDSAFDLFKRMKKRNIITWNSIITGFVQAGRPKEALEFFHEMQNLGDDVVSPDKITIASVLSACAYLGAIDHGKWVHSYLKRSGSECDMVIETALVDMYVKCGFVERAFEVFNEMPKKDVLAWTAMISGFALHGYGKEAFDLFGKMEKLGVRPNPVTFIGLLSGCAHSGLIKEARWCFNAMKRVYSIEPQVHHYACMVDILSRAALFDEVERLIETMPMEPDVFVWGALLGGCQMHGNLELGEKVALYLIALEPLNHAFYMTLCDIYGKAGKFDAAKRTRAIMKDKGIIKEVPGRSMIEIDGIVHEFSVRGLPDVVTKELISLLNGLSLVIR